MTDERAGDREARVAALMARRQDTASAANATAKVKAAVKPRRRSHAAAGGRVLALGLSASAAIVLTAAMANSAPSDATLSVTAAQPPIVLHIVRGDGQTSSVVLPIAPPETTAPATAPAATVPSAAKAQSPAGAVAAAPRAKATTKSHGS